MLIVQVCDFRDDGDGHYRLNEPSRQLGQLPDVTVVDVHFLHRSLPELTSAADVLVLHFVNDWELLSLCERRRAAGKVTVFEANDYFFDLQPWNPIAAQWLDRGVRELYELFLKSADAVQTSTDELARRTGDSAQPARSELFPSINVGQVYARLSRRQWNGL